MQRARYDVFVSHASKDDRQARALTESLRSLGARVFLGLDSLRDTSAWRDAVRLALSQSRAVVVLASSRHVQHGGASEELRVALDRARAGEQLLIPIFLDEPSRLLAEELTQFQGIQARDEVGLASAAAQIAEALDLKRRPSIGVDRVVSPILPNKPSPYVDTGFTEMLVSAIKLSTGQSAGALYVTGAPGVGKTTLVAEVCRRLAAESTVVWWVRASSAQMIVTDLADLGEELRLDSGGTAEEQARVALSYLEHSEQRWLLAFDDVSDFSALDRWLPGPSAFGTSVVTSREHRSSGFGRSIALESLNDDDSVRFLRRLLVDRFDGGVVSVDELLSLARHCGGSPLALSMVAGLARASPESLVRVLESLASSDRPPPNSALYNLIDSSVIRASGSSKEQEVLLSALGWTADADLATQLLVRGAEDVLGLGTSNEALRTAIEELEASGLVEVASGSIKAHPLIKGAARFRLDLVGLDVLLAALEAGLSGSFRQRTSWSSGGVYPHVVYLLALLRDLTQRERVVTLALRMARFLHGIADGTSAVDLLNRTLIECEGTLGTAHPSTLEVRLTLAGMYQGLGRLSEAAGLLEQALWRGDDLRNPGDPPTRANLAYVYQGLGRYSEAVELLQQTLFDSERVLGSDHPSTLAVRANLAGVFERLGSYSEAVELLQRTLFDSERVLGSDHPSTLTVRANLAGAFERLGRHPEAVELLQRTVFDSERVLGSDHPTTLTMRTNLAFVLDEERRRELR